MSERKPKNNGIAISGEIEVELAKLHDEYGDERLYAALINYLHRKLRKDLREDAV